MRTVVDTPLNAGPIGFRNGMTVRALKDLVRDWPETDDRGDPTEVWIGTRDNLSNQVHEACELGDGSLILEPGR